ncbi:hypothetical protein B0H13DRAFT_2674381 [Mycena leptocephala]|nr:hypothetical protein B0H13DRAFT_2674381 [Mycena leptocephala]
MTSRASQDTALVGIKSSRILSLPSGAAYLNVKMLSSPRPWLETSGVHAPLLEIRRFQLSDPKDLAIFGTSLDFLKPQQTLLKPESAGILPTGLRPRELRRPHTRNELRALIGGESEDETPPEPCLRAEMLGPERCCVEIPARRLCSFGDAASSPRRSGHESEGETPPGPGSRTEMREPARWGARHPLEDYIPLRMAAFPFSITHANSEVFVRLWITEPRPPGYFPRPPRCELAARSLSSIPRRYLYAAPIHCMFGTRARLTSDWPSVRCTLPSRSAACCAQGHLWRLGSSTIRSAYLNVEFPVVCGPMVSLDGFQQKPGDSSLDVEFAEKKVTRTPSSPALPPKDPRTMHVCFDGPRSSPSELWGTLLDTGHLRTRSANFTHAKTRFARELTSARVSVDAVCLPS